MAGLKWSKLTQSEKIQLGKLRNRKRTLEVLARDLYDALKAARPDGTGALLLRAEKLLRLEEES